MNNQKKVKFFISLLLLFVVALFAVSIFQLVKINDANNKLKQQQEQIEKLEKEIDYYENKNTEEDYETIT